MVESRRNLMLWAMTARLILACLSGGMTGWSQSNRDHMSPRLGGLPAGITPAVSLEPQDRFRERSERIGVLRGEYHLFYQGREFSELGNPEWGHALSTDLVHWKQLPIAIPKQPG